MIEYVIMHFRNRLAICRGQAYARGLPQSPSNQMSLQHDCLLAARGATVATNNILVVLQIRKLEVRGAERDGAVRRRCTVYCPCVLE